jgi:hypothetical protein
MGYTKAYVEGFGTACVCVSHAGVRAGTDGQVCDFGPRQENCGGT